MKYQQKREKMVRLARIVSFDSSIDTDTKRKLGYSVKEKDELYRMVNLNGKS